MKLALGTVQFGLKYGVANQTGQVSRSEAKAILQLALAKGIDTIDTAIAYGESESCLGEVGTENFKLITKLPPLPYESINVAAWVNQQVNESLSRMRVSAVYGLLLHRSDQLLGPNGADLFRSLQTLKDKEKVQKVGVSIYSPDELSALQSYHFDIVQAPFNLLDQRLLSSGWMHRLKDDGVEIHTRSAFLQGLLLMKLANIPTKFEHWSRLWFIWHQWLANRGFDAVEACLAFPRSFCEIDRVIVGVDNVNQFKQILLATDRKSINEFPDLRCEDENLINPAKWSKL